AEGAGTDLTLLEVPAQREPLVAVSAARRQWLRRHLVGLLRAGEAQPEPAPVAAETVGEPSVVERQACALCQGVCCGIGGDRAYLTADTLARVAGSADRPSPAQILRRYMTRVPREAVRGSCIYHGARGCTLERALRADVCNRHHCPPLRGFLRGTAARAANPVLVMAVEGSDLRDAALVFPEPQP